jgi:outer membrane protein TolC
MTFFDRKSISCAAAICASLLSGCNVGPRYTAPAAPAPPAFKEAAPAAYSNAPPGTWEPAQPQDAALKGKWWEMFKEPELNALEEQLNIDNQNIAQYFQNFMAARAQVREARAGYFPTVTANPAYTRSRVGRSAAGAAVTGTTGTTAVSTTTGATTVSDFSLPFDVSWEPDLWGRTGECRRSGKRAPYGAGRSRGILL